MNENLPSNENQAFSHKMMTSFIQIATLVILVGYCLMIVGPFIGIVIWGIVLAIAIYPLHVKFSGLLGGRQKWSATIIVLVGLVVLLVPGWTVTKSSVSTARTVAGDIHDGTFDIEPPNPGVADWPLIGKKVYSVWSEGAENMDAVLEQYEPQVRKGGEWLLHAASSMLTGLLHFTASIIIAGVFLMYAKSGYDLSATVFRRISPSRGEHLTDLSIATVRSVTNGVLGVAAIQAGLAGIGFWVMGIPTTGILTVVVLATAIVQIPAILIMAPLCVWVFSFADTVPATIFTVYSIGVGLSDNVLKPLLLGRGVDLPMLVVLLGAIGGVIKFGVIGLFLGAVILGLGYRIIADWIWPKEMGAAATDDAEPA